VLNWRGIDLENSFITKLNKKKDLWLINETTFFFYSKFEGEKRTFLRIFIEKSEIWIKDKFLKYSNMLLNTWPDRNFIQNKDPIRSFLIEESCFVLESWTTLKFASWILRWIIWIPISIWIFGKWHRILFESNKFWKNCSLQIHNHQWLKTWIDSVFIQRSHFES